MKLLHSRYRALWSIALLFSSPLLTGAGGNGCGGPVNVGPGTLTADADTSCAPSDCVGLGAATDAKICSDGTGLSRTVCAKQMGGGCAWDFPPCPASAQDAATSDPCAGKKCGDSCSTCLPNHGCVTNVQYCGADGVCGGAASCTTSDAGPVSCRSDADCQSGMACEFNVTDGCVATGTCFPSFSCPQGAICGGFHTDACGCDGKPVPYNGPKTTAAPSRSPFGCDQGIQTQCQNEGECSRDELCVGGACVKQCTAPVDCGPNAACLTDFCFGPNGCNPPPRGTSCPPVCYGFCWALAQGDGAVSPSDAPTGG